jgi:hypothetical protein
MLIHGNTLLFVEYMLKYEKLNLTLKENINMDIRILGNELIATLNKTNMFLGLIVMILLLNLLFNVIFSILRLKRKK